MEVADSSENLQGGSGEQAGIKHEGKTLSAGGEKPLTPETWGKPRRLKHSHFSEARRITGNSTHGNGEASPTYKVYTVQEAALYGICFKVQSCIAGAGSEDPNLN